MSPRKSRKLSGHLKRQPGPLREATKAGAGLHGGSARQRHRRERREVAREIEQELLDSDEPWLES